MFSAISMHYYVINNDNNKNYQKIAINGFIYDLHQLKFSKKIYLIKKLDDTQQCVR